MAFTVQRCQHRIIKNNIQGVFPRPTFLSYQDLPIPMAFDVDDNSPLDQPRTPTILENITDRFLTRVGKMEGRVTKLRATVDFVFGGTEVSEVEVDEGLDGEDESAESVEKTDED